MIDCLFAKIIVLKAFPIHIDFFPVISSV